MVGLSAQQPIRHSIKRNVAFNVIGGVWTIALNLLAVRFQLNILGAEAYGLISFGASLQLFFSLFELGISTLIIREVAKDDSPNLQATHSLIQTALFIFWTVAFCLGVIIFLSSDWLVNNWITLEKISTADATFVVRMWSIALAFNHPMILYLGLMAGLQRLDIGNLVKAGVVTAYLGGGILLLILTRSITLYMIWNAITSLVGGIVYVVITRRLLKGVSLRPRFSLDAVRTLWRVALQLVLITLLGLVFTQSDKILISRMLPVKHLGFYAAAFTIITGITALQGFITSAFMPALAADYGRGDLVTMRVRYYKMAQILVYMMGLFAFVCVFFGRDILSIWTTLETAEGSYRTLGLLAFGSLLNASVSAGYIVCVVTNNIRIPTLVNLAIVWLYWPALYGLILIFGIEGAALTWVLLNLYYVIVLAYLIQNRILHEAWIVWASKTIIPYFALGLIFGIGSLIAQPMEALFQRILVCLVSTLIYLIVGFRLLEKTTQESIARPLLRFTTMLK